MAYLRQKTWIATGPRRVGMGDAGIYAMGGAIPPSTSPCYNPNDWGPHLLNMAGADENACLATNPAAAAIALNANLSNALSPGLPVGYDPSTGLVDPDNTSGATQSQGDSIAAALQAQLNAAVSPGGVSDPAAAASASASMSLLLLGVGGLLIAGFLWAAKR